MAPLNPDQVRTRDRFETLIGLMAPALNLVLAAGERVSRLAAPEDYEYYPPRTTEAEPPPKAPSTAGTGD